MMKLLFVDTAGWMACADSADPAHRPSCDARDAALEQGATLLTTDYVIDETLTLIRRRLSHRAARDWWEQLEQSSRLRLEWIGVARVETARKIFFCQSDKTCSFTDCTRFAVMKEMGISRVLTSDDHFRQMGFHVMPDLFAKSRQSK